jgi:poly-gamma-glutamate capsule biosynthesis protein CapA/YwtB (metallophosphatase superfamily)
MVQEDKDQLTLDLEKARMQADIVVCSFHWGISRGHREIVDYQIEL